ncbi:MAG: hypothetical protein OEO23_10135 [Gemmatimonadota bacterium]|jgi:hypothetical protein|nr:hypothetical protein [Gemmatimonadota bacterium]
MTDTRVVAHFPNRHEGELAKGFLVKSGIDAALLADDAGGAEAGLTFVNHARLMVRAEDDAQARRVLSDAGYDSQLVAASDGGDP